MSARLLLIALLAALVGGCVGEPATNVPLHTIATLNR